MNFFDAWLQPKIKITWTAAWCDFLMLWITKRSSWLLILVFMILVLLFLRKWQLIKITAIALAWAGVCDIVFYNVFKPFWSRLRPCHTIESIRLLSEQCGGLYSFPSNHAGNGMAFLLVFWALTKNHNVLWGLPIVFIVGYSRVYVGVHYPSDVLVGFIIAAVLSWLFIVILNHLNRTFKIK